MGHQIPPRSSRSLEWRKPRGGGERRAGLTASAQHRNCTCIIGIIGTAGADIDTGTSTSPDAGCIDFASRSASAATFG